MNWKQTIYSSHRRLLLCKARQGFAQEQNEFVLKRDTRLYSSFSYFHKRKWPKALGANRQKMNKNNNLHSKLTTNSNFKFDSLVCNSNGSLEAHSANILRPDPRVFQRKTRGKKDLDFHKSPFSKKTASLVKPSVSRQSRVFQTNTRESRLFLRKRRQNFLSSCFFNQCFDKGRLKNFVLWFLKNYGQKKTVTLVEQLKNIGFDYASKAGISLGIDDLKIPPRKNSLIFEAEKQTTNTIHQYVRGEITGVERFQRLIDIWHRTSEALKQEVIDHFEATDILNPVYMMAFSGARGNVSQVRQLVGMRGLMADPQGQIIDFPIRSNFREGLTLTEYLISSYGARKGIVDTALRTANAGYLTRRLVDVAQHVIISHFDCGTHRGIFLKDMKEGNKTIYSLVQRVVGRILARDLIDTSLKTQNPSQVEKGEQGEQETENSKESYHQREPFTVLAKRNQEVTLDLALSILQKFDKVFVRSPLTCETNQLICQLCYGWSLGQGSTLVSIGEAVGVIAAQSIGEPGTQLTMRTFHTGGVFSGDISDQIRAPFDGIVEYSKAIPGTLIRTPEGKIAFFTKSEGFFLITQIVCGAKTDRTSHQSPSDVGLLKVPEESSSSNPPKKIQFKVPCYTLIYIRNAQSVKAKEVIAQISTISRKTNATDEAALTIESEYEGQFYSKTLSFREKFLGDAKIMEAALEQSRDSKSNPFAVSSYGEQSLFQNSLSRAKTHRTSLQTPLTKKASFSKNGLQSIDKVYEAWTWGYAWILSGKIYELNLQGEMCFPKLGDLVNSKSSMNQTQWNLNFHNGPAQLSYTSKNPKLGSKQYLQNGYTLNPQTHLQMKKESLLSNVNVVQPLLFFDVLKIRFHKSVYVFKSQNKSPLLEKNAFGPNVDQNDLLLRMYALRSRDINSSNDNFKTSKKTELKKGKRTLLHWFPNQFQTSTGGSVFFEDLFKSQKIYSDIDSLFSSQMPAAEPLDQFNQDHSHSSLSENQTLSETKTVSPVRPKVSRQGFPQEKQPVGSFLSPSAFHSKNLKNNLFFQNQDNPNSFSPLIKPKVSQDSPFSNKTATEGAKPDSPVFLTEKHGSLAFFEQKGDRATHNTPILKENGESDGNKVSAQVASGVTGLQKESVSMSLKNELIQKFKTESLLAQRQYESFMTVRNQENYPSLKRSKLNESLQEHRFVGNKRTSDFLGTWNQKSLTLNKDFFKSRAFGMRWKNPYQLYPKVAYNNLIDTVAVVRSPAPPCSKNTGREFSIPQENLQRQFSSAHLAKNVTGTDQFTADVFGKKMFFNIGQLGFQNIFKTSKKNIRNQKNFFNLAFLEEKGDRGDLSFFFNRRLFWIPNQFYRIQQNPVAFFEEKGETPVFFKEKNGTVQKKFLRKKRLEGSFLSSSVYYTQKSYLKQDFLKGTELSSPFYFDMSFFNSFSLFDMSCDGPARQGFAPGTSGEKPPVFIQINRQGYLKNKLSSMSFPSLLKSSQSRMVRTNNSHSIFSNMNQSFAFKRNWSFNVLTGNKVTSDFIGATSNHQKKRLENSFVSSDSLFKLFQISHRFEKSKSYLSFFTTVPGFSEKKPGGGGQVLSPFSNKKATVAILKENDESRGTEGSTTGINDPGVLFFPSDKTFPCFKEPEFNDLMVQQKSESLNSRISHLSTFCMLMSTYEMKQNKTWLSYLKIYDSNKKNQSYSFFKSNQFRAKPDSPVFEENGGSPVAFFEEKGDRGNKRPEGPFISHQNIQIPNVSEYVQTYNIVSNSIKKQIKKTNSFVHQKQFSLYLISLNFQQSINPRLTQYEDLFSSKSISSVVKPSISRDSPFFSLKKTRTVAETKIATDLKKKKSFQNVNPFPSKKVAVFKENGEFVSPGNKVSGTNKDSSLTNIQLKKGWVYFYGGLPTTAVSCEDRQSQCFSSKNTVSLVKPKVSQQGFAPGTCGETNPLTNLVSYHKKILYPGQKTSLALNSSTPLYLECVSINDIFDFESFLGCSLNDTFSPKKKIDVVNFLPCRSHKNSSSFCEKVSSVGVFAENSESHVHVFDKNAQISKKIYDFLRHERKDLTRPQKTTKTKKCIKNLNSRFIFSSNFDPSVRKNNSNILDENGNGIPIFDLKNLKKQNSFFKSYLHQQDLPNHKDSFSWRETRKKKIQLLKKITQLKSTFIEQTFPSKSFLVLLIQPVVESMQKNLKELSTYVDDSTLKFKRNFFTKTKRINHSSSSRRFRSTLVHFSFHSLLQKRIFYSPQFNKQKTTSQPLFKHPTSHLKIIPMSIDRKLESYNSYHKMSTPYYGSFQSYQRPTNLGPFFLTYTRPMGIDYMFKTQNVSLAHKSLSNFDSILFPSFNSNLSSFLQLYVKEKQSPFSHFFKVPSSKKKATEEKTPDPRVFPILQKENLQRQFFSVPTTNKTALQAKQNPNLNHFVCCAKPDRVSHLNPLADTFINSIPNLVQSPCFSFSHFFQLKNPILTFENLQRVGPLFDQSHISSERSRRLSQKMFKNSLHSGFSTGASGEEKGSIVLKSNKGRCFVSSLSNTSSTVFSYNQRNKLFRGIQFIAQTNIYSPFNGEIVLLNSVKGCIVLTTTDLMSYYLLSTKSSSPDPRVFQRNTRGQEDLQSPYSTNTASLEKPLVSRKSQFSSSPPCFSEKHTGQSRSAAQESNSLDSSLQFKNEFSDSEFSKRNTFNESDSAASVGNKVTSDFIGDFRAKEFSTAVKEPFYLRSYSQKHKSYPINDILVKFLNMTDVKLDPNLLRQLGRTEEGYPTDIDLYKKIQNDTLSFLKSSPVLKVSNLIGGQPIDLSLKLRLGDFCFYGDPITETTAIQTSGQLIHFNQQKITLRRGQPIFISPKGILHKFDNDFVDFKTPVITLSYQKLKTGDIIQGIPKVEQFFEARTTKRGRFFRDSLPYLLKTLFKRYRTKLPLDLAVRQSFYKIQQILVDGVHRVYKSQGVSISDKHLEVIVKQMTSKVRIIDGAQTGFFPGEVVDLYFIEKINSFLMKKITYEPLVLGITKSSLEVDSFLSAASFQQTTRVLSKAALFRKKDFLKGLKENVILGNLIPAGTGFLVYIDL